MSTGVKSVYRALKKSQSSLKRLFTSPRALANMDANYDLLIVTDATGSMGVFLSALSQAIPEILALSQLAGGFARVGVIAYRDYNFTKPFDWSGWNPMAKDLSKCLDFLRQSGRGDWPEAAKTGLVKALDVVDPSRNTLILWYADAPPHHPSQSPESDNAREEKEAHGRRSIDWCHLIYEARASNCTVFSFTIAMGDGESSFYTLLSQLTGGVCLALNKTSDSALVSRLTLDVLLAWLGQAPTSAGAGFEALNLTTIQFLNPPPVDPPLPNETSTVTYLPTRSTNPWEKPEGSPEALQPKSKTPLGASMNGIPQIGSSSLPSLAVLARRFADKSQVVYRQAVYRGLQDIISHNVVALSYNPIFGQLWRSVCKESTPEKEALVNLFSLKVSGLQDTEEKRVMKAFVESSYDASEQIEEMIAGAPPGADRVYLDLDVMGPGGVDLTRMELLEVSRSCYSGVIAKVATILTHAKLAAPDFTLRPDQRFVPLSLSSTQIFQLLPSLVVEGTLFSARPAAIMAILALIVGVPFLREPAIDLLSRFKGKWLDTNVPENISYEFANLILQGPNQADDGTGLYVTPHESAFYEGMRRYRLLELNLRSTLTAQVPWTPDKSRGVGDEKVKCKTCGIMRSKTMMSNDPAFVGVCGICSDAVGMKAADWKDEGDEQSCWTECTVKSCRAQYVIVNVAALRVPPKCWYCRTNNPCPYVECTRCKSRVILPNHLRSEGSGYLCVACKNASRPTIVDIETQLKALINQNGLEWLGLKANGDLFHNKSAFKLFAAHGDGVFLPPPLPSADKSLSLALESRPVLNAAQVLSEIERRVAAGTVDLGTCTLCFESFPHSSLTPACGRSGCTQRVDSTCLAAWYGTNRPGTLLNLMRCLCPFCRRKPSAKTMSKFNARVAALGGLQQAIADPAWYYAWCIDCGFAKRALERMCCEGERLPVVAGFRCEECVAVANARERAAPAPSSDQVRSGIKPCPKCGVMVEKTFGCNHITCACGQHWCYACGGGYTLQTIYGHMNEAHGGFYDNGDEGDWDEDGADEDE